jgi:flagellin
MSTVINTNVSAFIAQNAMTVNSRAQTSAMQQLSTGKRVNSAQDDAAGLAIGAKMTAQIKGLDQAVRNGNDGISMLQTADGAMVEMSNMIQRMRELSVQSSNDSNTAEDRTNLDGEYQQLKGEITRIGANTQWNGMNILNGNNSLGTVSGNNQTVKFQVGANADQTIDIDFKDFTFTPSGTPSTPSVTTINFAGHSAGADTARMTATFGSVSANVTFGALSADATTAEVASAATSMQTQLRTYAGLEGITVTAAGETITIADASGKAASAVTFLTAGGAAATTPNIATTYANGSASSSTAPAGGTFSSNMAGSAITTLASANLSSGYLDTALSSLNTERSKIGATINRLTYAVDNLTNVSQNTSASRSRVMDTDYAKASTELSRTQIIAQAATAMLAQANQSQQSVLALLK